MARRRRPRHSPPAGNDDPAQVARRRAKKLRSQGNYRKAALALREWVRLTDAPKAWVAFGAMLARARRNEQALDALKQGLWRYRQNGDLGRARSVARVILSIDPYDSGASRLVEAAA